MSEPAAPVWYLYLVRCADRSLYTGVATDVERRFAEHQSGGGRGSRYLRGRGPLKLELVRPIGDRGMALRLEYRIKQLSRAKKERLLQDDGGLIQALLAELASRD
ncbi:MAG: GIY-YIG nuclease family protein [Pseudomonadota bacterium]